MIGKRYFSYHVAHKGPFIQPSQLGTTKMISHTLSSIGRGGSTGLHLPPTCLSAPFDGDEEYDRERLELRLDLLLLDEERDGWRLLGFVSNSYPFEILSGGRGREVGSGLEARSEFDE